MVVVSVSKSKKVKKLNDRLKKEFMVVEEVAFDCTKNGDHYNPLYPKYSNRMYLSCHINDNAIRSILHLVLVDLNMESCSNEGLCKFMVANDIWDETQASVFALNYIANKGSD